MKYLLSLLFLSALVVAQEPEKAPAQPKPEAKSEAKPVAKNPVVIMKTTMGEVEIELFADKAPKTVANFIGLAEGTKESTDVKTNQKVKRPFYDGIAFHRVIDNFMIQGGCPIGTGTGGPGYRLDDEMDADGLGLAEKKAFKGQKPIRDLGIQSQRQMNMVVRPIYERLGIKSEADFKAKKAEFDKALAALTVKQAFENMGFRYSKDGSPYKPVRGAIAMANTGIPNTNGSQFFINLIDTPWLAGKHTVFGKVVKGMEVVDKIGKVKVDAGSKPVEPVKIVSIRLKKAES
ncbi:MAG: peptidylprolyl isomerase [Planctomycetota bacterium]|jgi:peptidyl-prolyl cis-trans isomerase A (cyclophilin A)